MPAYFDLHETTAYRGATQVFDALSLTLNLGTNSAILGPNGSGKTTLLKLLMRELYPLARPNSYVKLFGSETVVVSELRQKMGFVSQDFQAQYDAHVKVEDVILSGLFGSIGIHGHQTITDVHRENVENSLQTFQLSSLRKRAYWHLSTGQQRMVLLARAMVHRPEVLVLDEPTSGLDLRASFAFLDAIEYVVDIGTTLLLVTHHLEEIIPAIDEVILLKTGKVMSRGSKPEQLRSDTLSALYDTPLQVLEQDGHYRTVPIK